MSQQDLDARKEILLQADRLGLECLEDNDGQIVIYTGLALPKAGQKISGTFEDAVAWEDPEGGEECDECGAAVPADATSLGGPWHQESCSLHEAL